MSDMPSARQPELYWRQLEQLKASGVCVRMYRNQFGKKVRAVEIIKLVASSGSIAGWAVFQNYPIIWASIIAAAQFLDAIKSVFPFAKTHKAASELTIALEVLWIEAEEEWESIYAGKLTEEAIGKRRTRLRKLQLDAEKKYFPEGFETSVRLRRLATEEARRHFEITYSQGSTNDQS